MKTQINGDKKENVKNFRNYLFAALGFMILVGSLALSGSPASQAAPPDKDVVVVNTSAHPVPVQVQGTPNVNIANMPAVGIDASRNTVQVGNTTSSPVLVRDVDNPARQPFQAIVSATLNPSVAAFVQNVAIVPVGKRLVIEFVSAIADVPADQKVVISVFNQDKFASRGVSHSFPVTPQGTFSGIDRLVASESARMYAEPEDSVNFVVSRNSAAGTANCFFSISGYLVDV